MHTDEGNGDAWLDLAARFDPALAITLEQVDGGSGGESAAGIFARLHDAP